MQYTYFKMDSILVNDGALEAYFKPNTSWAKEFSDTIKVYKVEKDNKDWPKHLRGFYVAVRVLGYFYPYKLFDGEVSYSEKLRANETPLYLKAELLKTAYNLDDIKATGDRLWKGFRNLNDTSNHFDHKKINAKTHKKAYGKERPVIKAEYNIKWPSPSVKLNESKELYYHRLFREGGKLD